MQVHTLAHQNSVFSSFLAEIRDAHIQKDPLRFRRNLERIGEIIAYELSKHLEFTEKEIETPLGMANCKVLKSQPVIATILRAGLPLHTGVLNYFDRAENAFISAYRQHHADDTFDIQLEYLASPSIEGKDLVICDPMLATGRSMVAAYKAMLKRGVPRHIHVVSVIGSAEGVEYVRRFMPDNTTIWIGDVDEELTAQAYIVPGLGDAGDLAFGEKI
ncbi:MAG TPA: uracil phosphoribosyltransferase [Flavobacteriales bacterium]|nr:uracil phosphoribosyltransferase [Flavobacteriales bacterium]HRJ36940.1 uracil phosphoribosyltransferase [Flavobacteriales bacterium]HRJ40191.1 uracil phosphoribosyltransferase [Flavobacteriales bacterium]